MSQSADILKTAPSAPPSDSLLSNDPQFQGFGGETISIALRLRLRAYPTKSFRLEKKAHLLSEICFWEDRGRS
jgi:hypothetical protein